MKNHTNRQEYGLPFRQPESQRALMVQLTGDCELAADDAFTEMYHDYFAPLVRKAEGYLVDLSEYGVAKHPEDIAQEAMLRLWEKRKTLDPNSTGIYAYLMRVVVNLSLNELRDVHKQNTELLDTSPEAMAEEPGWEPASNALAPDKILERKELFKFIMKSRSLYEQ